MNKIDSIIGNILGKKKVKGASIVKQQQWKGFSPIKKQQLRRRLPDSDGDRVPNKFDCQPRNPRMQDTSIVGTKVFRVDNEGLKQPPRNWENNGNWDFTNKISGEEVVVTWKSGPGGRQVDSKGNMYGPHQIIVKSPLWLDNKIIGTYKNMNTAIVAAYKYMQAHQTRGFVP